MKNPTVLISGASVAGLSVAYWLRKHGFRPTVIERAPAIREGGYKVDLRGAAIEVASRMGILEAIRGACTDMQGASFVDATGKTFATVSAELFGLHESADVEIMRGTLARLLFERAQDGIEYVFGDSITAIVQGPERVCVVFEKGEPRDFDLVIGADGMHSNVRSLVFGEESEFIRDFGAYVSIFTVPNHLDLDRSERVYVSPGKTANVYSTRGDNEARALFLFASEPVAHDRRDLGAQKRILRDVFGGEAWEIPRLLEAMERTPDFYFDRVAQIQIDRWSNGRVVLLGDAGYAPSLASGQGSSQAVVGAYVLAGELAAADGDHVRAFENYERVMRGYVNENQELGREAIKHMIVRSKEGLWVQTLMLRVLPHLPQMALGWFYSRLKRRVEQAANAVTIEDYASAHTRDGAATRCAS
ncbi:monooxygenase, FAD-binding [Labilithrix luteola]|uniref:Monooxygenase, FAD-binding n=1 Tax=Labilithrix luteola TaxID=1391654 RepID=A0A0K1PND3_9BACT|nr:FAD-dependent monooxygenase [Labilithrix luteola]AKU94619.1 monooxygenase, FAD-binding [Labilithrix luteola]